MPDWTNIIYLYDGSFDGFLCCVFESYATHEIPDDIIPDHLFVQEVLWGTRQIETDGGHAERVLHKLNDILGKNGLRLIRCAFLYGLPGKEKALLRFIRFSLVHGKAALNMLGRKETAAVYDMEKAVLNEAHLLKGFLRFSDYHGALLGTIQPKHYVLPLLKRHFAERYPEEYFIIFDQSHKMALLYRPYTSRIILVDSFEPPSETSCPERQFRRLWQEYYDAIAIKQRKNPRCRMTHMPRRFWACMTEFQEKETETAPLLTIPSSFPKLSDKKL